MSVRLAAGCALSRSHGVSVVPMIQCRPHGMTNSTDVSVRTMKPASERIRSRGTTRWMPLDACTLSCAAAADHLLDLVGPDAGGVDDDPGPDLEVGAVLEVPGAYADDPLALAEEAGDLDPGGDVRAVARRGAGDGHHEPGVVDLAVVVADRTGDRLRREVRRDPGDAPAGQVPVLGHAHVVLPGHRHGVVQREPGADVGALPHLVGQRVEERHRPDQVRREPGQQQAALLEGLPDQAEVEHLEVAQPAVDELAAAAAGAAGQVALLDQPGRQAAGHGVEGHPGADHSPADDQDVELLGGHRV